MVSIHPNTLLDIEDASSSYVNSEVDQYDITKIYEQTFGTFSAFPPAPESLTFETRDVGNWYDYRNASLVVSFKIIKETGKGDDMVTCLSDIRSIFSKCTLKMNDVIVSDNNFPNKYSVYNRLTYSKQYYDTSAKEWLCYDIDPTNANPALVSNAAVTTVKPHAMWTGAGATAPTWQNDYSTGLGQRYRLTNAREAVGAASPSGEIGNEITCRIPLMFFFPFHAAINTVLKNVKTVWIFTLVDEPYQKLVNLDDPGQPITDGKGFVMTGARIELPRVIPSPARQISLNNALLNSPKLSIGYANYQMYSNQISIGASQTQNLLIQNTTERVLRVTCWLMHDQYDTTDRFLRWMTNTNKLDEFSLEINGVRVPSSITKFRWNDQRVQTLGGPELFDISDPYRYYQDATQNSYLYNPTNTKDGILAKYQGSGWMNPFDFGTSGLFLSFDIARSKQSQDFIGGSSSISASMHFKEEISQNYVLWTCIENSSLVDISLQERSAFLVVK